MKNILFSLILTILLPMGMVAQSVPLTFTGKDANNNWVPLDRVSVTNLTKGWQETIYWPDTTLTMQNGTGIDDYASNGGFSLSQNNPNPFNGATDVLLMVADAGTVTLEIADVNGRLVVGANDYSPLPGHHQFRITLSAAGTYVMTARQNGKTASIKMVNNGGGNGDVVECAGIAETMCTSSLQLKSGTRGTTNNPFDFGDVMEYMGYATINGVEYESERISQMQDAPQTIALMFAAMQHTVPLVTTTAVSNITDTSAIAGGIVDTDGGETVFDRGICYSTIQGSTISDGCIHIGQGTGSFSDILNGLLPETTYYVRAFAINSIGVSYGNEVNFTTEMETLQYGQPCPDVPTLTDIDGNVYNTVLIGTQCWMKENLRTTKYADSTSILQGSIASDTLGYWYYPNDSSSNKPTYGLLYNWKAVMHDESSSTANPSGVQGICPMGWHVPSDAEWKQMEMALGMSQSDAELLLFRDTIAAKLSGNTGWTSSSNANAAGNLSAPDRNLTGFSALPAGSHGGHEFYFGIDAMFWSATEDDSDYAWERYLYYRNAGVGRHYIQKFYGNSVRCLRD